MAKQKSKLESNTIFNAIAIGHYKSHKITTIVGESTIFAAARDRGHPRN